MHKTPNDRLELGYFGILGMMALLSLGGVLFVRMAVRFINPVLVSVLRTFEIVMALVLELAISSYLFDFENVSFYFKVSGSIIVTLSAVLMALTDKISKFLGCNRNAFDEKASEDGENAKKSDQL